jgi:hypothetical protein
MRARRPSDQRLAASSYPRAAKIVEVYVSIFGHALATEHLATPEDVTISKEGPGKSLIVPVVWKARMGRAFRLHETLRNILRP